LGARVVRPVGTAAIEPDEVRLHLENVLESTAFRSSNRSCQFLRYVVEASLAGDADALKERLLGEKIFGRSPDYDTGQDSIVRVKANEVRRRLAQYYDLHPDSPLRIELPAGSYAPLIHRGHSSTAEFASVTVPAPRPPAARRLSWVWLALALAPLAAGAYAVWSRAVPPSPFTRFWSPFLSGPRNSVLCIPTPETYRIYGGRKQALIDALRPREPGAPAPAFEAGQLQGVQIVPETGDSIGLGDAHAMTLLYAFASARGRPPELRAGNDTTFTELRSGPSVLIGGFTNRWSIDLLKETRFAFESAGAEYGIRDRKNGSFVCRKEYPWEPRHNEDCAVVTRIPNSKTGHPLLVGAGLDHFGTFAVGEFLTRPELLEPVLRGLAADWPSKNVQIVFRIEIVRDNIGPPKVLATEVW
jgi:hypothetical protein